MFDPLLLALTSGLSIFNHLKNNKHSEKLQAKQQEFARASVERNRQRMWEVLREGQEITLQMEEEAHQARIQDINDDFDKVLHRLAYNQAINTWPLKVLPIVMKNQSLGTLLCGSNENVALHCILTPSNCSTFNNYVLPEVEDALTDFCNLHWSSLSAHPVLFYSGAWKSYTNPTGIEVQQLRTDLRNLPTLMITPYFKPDGGLVFQLNAWGIGNDVRADVECQDFSYAQKYALGLDFKDDSDLRTTTIEELIPYLQCLIGYVADQYFWLMHNESPLLPSLLAIKAVSCDGKPYLKRNSEDHYTNLLSLCETETKDLPFAPDKALPLFEGSSELFSTDERKKKLEDIFIAYVQKLSGGETPTMRSALSSDVFSKEDISFVRKFIQLYKYEDYAAELKELLTVLEYIDFDYSILESTDIPYLEKLAEEGSGAAMYRLGEIYEYSIGTDINEGKSTNYYECSVEQSFLLAEFHELLSSISVDSHLSNERLKALTLLVNHRVVQSIIYAVWLNHKGLIDTYDISLLEVLDDYEDSRHPYLFFLGALIVEDQYGVEYIDHIITLLEKSAEFGYVGALKKLMDIYLLDKYNKQDFKQHVRYAIKAAEQGDVDAITDLGICYATGQGVKQSKARAMDLLTLAVELGSTDAEEFINKIK